jgi:hypothetical protein
MTRLAALGLAAALSPACFQSLDSSADKATRGVVPAEGPSTAIEPTAIPISLDPDDEQRTTDDPCQKTRLDKTQILTAHCSKCHSGSGAKGLPPFDFVLDDARLVSSMWVRTGQPSQRFLIPGDPDHSALFLRASTDMPPIPTDVGTSGELAPSASDLSVLREWILHCL